MKILLAVNLEQLEKYISNFENVEVCGITRNKKNILEKVLQLQPEVIMISHSLPGEENMAEIINKLTSKNYPTLRIVYLYGSDDNERKEFINFLIGRAVYDYYYGDGLTPELVNTLLFQPKSRDDVKHDIITVPPVITSVTIPPQQQNDPIPTITSTPIAVQEPVQQKPIDKLKFVQEIVRELTTEQKREMGLIETKEINNTIVVTDILGTVIITVGGVANSIGTTHNAIHIAYFLSRRKNKNKVAILNQSEKNHFQILNTYVDKKALNDNSFKYKNVDFYYNTTLLELKNYNYYDYIVIDLGLVKKEGSKKNKNYENMILSDLSILVCNSKPWQSEYIINTLYNDNDCSHSKNWKILFNLSDDDFFNELKKELKYWDIHKSSYCPDLFKPYAELDAAYTELLQSVLPTGNKVINKKPFLASIKELLPTKGAK